MPSTPMFAVKTSNHSAAPRGLRTTRAFPLVALVLCLVPGGIANAGDPASVLPEGVFATGEGCTMLAQSGTDEIDVMDFLVLTNGELTGMDFACKFTDAEAGTTDNHKSYAVKATCESGAPGVPAVITIKEMSDGELHLTMKSEGDVDDLGDFARCPSVAE